MTATIAEDHVMTDMPAVEYHAVDAVSASLLKRVAKSPLHAKHYLDHPQQQTPAMFLGDAGHCAILEPERFLERYIQAPDYDRRTKDGKRLHAEFTELHKGKTLISLEQMEAVNGMAAAVLRHPVASKLIDGLTHREASVFWECPTTGLACKSRIDGIEIDGEYTELLDIKTASDISRRAFASSVASLGYDIQSDHYARASVYGLGRICRTFRFILVESAPPHDVAIYTLGLVTRNEAERKVDDLMQLWAACKKHNRFPGQETTEVSVEMAKFGFSED